jgi:hypothetical protein
MAHAVEIELANLLYGAPSRLIVEDREHAQDLVQAMVRTRSYRGCGSVERWYPRTIARWRGDDLIASFCASNACRAWREDGHGICLEESLFRFFEDADVGEPEIREEEMLAAVVRALAVTPRARFVWPAAVRRAPGGCWAITRRNVLHAALNGRYVTGPVTPLVAAVLAGTAHDPKIAAELARLRLIW